MSTTLTLGNCLAYSEWTSNLHRDTYASYIGHPPLLEYMSIGMGEPVAKLRTRFIEKMIQPVGKPPEKED